MQWGCDAKTRRYRYKKIDKKFNQIFTKWVQVENKIQFTLTHSTEEIVNLLMHQVPFNQVA